VCLFEFPIRVFFFPIFVISIFFLAHCIVIQNENEIDVKYQLSGESIDWVQLPGFPIKFAQKAQPSLESRTEQAMQALVEEAKHKKEREAEPLRKVCFYL
jgi:hypothetical protein